MDVCSDGVLQKDKYYTLADDIQCENVKFVAGTTIWIAGISVLPGCIHKYELMDPYSSDFLCIPKASANKLLAIFKENKNATQDFNSEYNKADKINQHISNVIKHFSSILCVCLILTILFFILFYIWNNKLNEFEGIVAAFITVLIEAFPLTLYLCVTEMIYRFYRNKLNKQKLSTAKQILTQYNLDKS